MLGTLFIVAGVLIICASIGWFALGKKVGKERKLISLISGCSVGVFMSLTNSIMFYAEPGYSYLVQYPTGTQISVTDPGYHFRFFGNLIPIKKVMTVKFYTNREKPRIKSVTSSGRLGPVPVRFNDAVTAEVALSVRMRMPTGQEQFKGLAIDFRSQDNLMHASLIPFVREAVRNAARMLSAQDYISGKGGEFEMAILDQLENGVYILETREIKTSKRRETITTDESRTIKNRAMVKYEVRVKLDDDGNRLRKRHPLKTYGIAITQAPVEDVDPEPKFKEMLAKQRDAAAEANVEKQTAKKAEYQKQRIIAEGESQKAQIRVEQEKSQISKLISAETDKKEALIDRQKKAIMLETARLEAKAKKVRADAEAYERERLMKADNALALRLEAIKEINRYYAEAIKGAKLVPEIMITNGGSQKGGSSIDLINLLTAQTAKQIATSMKAK